MMDAPLISVIIPVYNKEKTIEKCVHSVLNQRYPNIEVILVDDGSRDSSYDLCVRLSSEHPNITVVHQENKGVSAARNVGLSLARGEFVSFVDSDDWLHEHMLATLLENMDQETDISVCCCFAVLNDRCFAEHFFDGDIVTDETFQSKKKLVFQLFDTAYGQPQSEIYTGVGVPWAKLYRKDIFTRNQYRFDEELSHLEDNFLNLQLFLSARKIVYIDTPLYYYSTEHIQTVLKKYDKKVVFSYAKVSVLRYEWLSGEGLLQKEDVKPLLDRETINLLNIAIIAMTFNPERHLTKKQLIHELRWLNETIGIREVLNHIDLRLVQSPVARAAYFLLKHRNYTLAYECLALRNKLK
jgi:glycosyltransferase involved in cell wall biosynthesis